MLDISSVSVSFSRYGKGLRKTFVSPVSDISLQIAAGEIVAVIGSSGSGKSLLAHALLGLLPRNARRGGMISFKGAELHDERMQRLRGREISLIPQSVAYLNPLAKVGRQVCRAASLSGFSRQEAGLRTEAVFKRYSLAAHVPAMFPFQVSGGMARRVLTATATVGKADLIIADEPTTGLDHEVVKKALQHLTELADEGKAILLITHDLEAAISICHTVVVVYAGKTVEIAPVSCFRGVGKLLHPYTRALWNALPQNSFAHLPGNQPAEIDPTAGCVFSPRCPVAQRTCQVLAPDLTKMNGSLVRCPYAAC